MVMSIRVIETTPEQLVTCAHDIPNILTTAYKNNSEHLFFKLYEVYEMYYDWRWSTDNDGIPMLSKQNFVYSAQRLVETDLFERCLGLWCESVKIDQINDECVRVTVSIDINERFFARVEEEYYAHNESTS